MCRTYAEFFVDRLVEATDKLEEHPQIGRRVPEAEQRDDIRELIVQGYRIIYQTRPDDIQVLTVIHGARDLAGAQEKPWE